MKQDSIERPVRVGVISLGCAKNLVDSEVMVGTLLKDGVEITSDTAQADVVIVNTCSFIDSAQQESVDTILESAELREAKNRGQGLIVSGCLPQRFREQLPALLPEVDVFMGIDQVAQVTDIVKQALTRRAERLRGSLKSKVQGPKSKVQSPKSKVQGPKPKVQSPKGALMGTRRIPVFQGSELPLLLIPSTKVVRIAGLEPARVSPLPPQSSVSANSTICPQDFP